MGNLIPVKGKEGKGLAVEDAIVVSVDLRDENI